MDAYQLKKLIKTCIREIVSEGRRICAWCKKDMGEFSGSGDTHGICQDCYKKVMSTIKPDNKKTNNNS